MKKTAIDYLNFCLTGIFILLLILYGITLIKKKEFDKLSWSAKIIAVEPNSTDEKSGMVKILDAVFVNTFNQSENRLEHDSPKIIVSKKGSDSAYFWTQDDLLPDSLSIKYFSVEEKKFYQLNTKLPSEKMQSSLDNGKRADLKLEVQPKGKITLKLDMAENGKNKSKIIGSFQAKEFVGKLDMLVFKESAEQARYNEFPSLRDVSDYSDVLTQKYSWAMKIETENSEKISETSAYAFDGKSMKTGDETFEDVKLRNIPNRISIDWGSTQRYGSSYSFDSQEILDAFKELNQINSNEPIHITFKLFKNAFPKAELSKGGKIISLKDTYPDLPIHYAN